MKKVYSILTLTLFMLSCEEPQPEFSPQSNSDLEITDTVSSFNNCGLPGSGVYTKNGDYNCNQYVRGALLGTGNNVNLSNGDPGNNNFTGLSQFHIQEDPDFIRVCDIWDAEATAVLPKILDHSSLKVGSTYYYSYPGSIEVHRSSSPLNYGSACDYEYYASIEDIYISGPQVLSGNKYKFTLQNKGNHSYITNDSGRWSYDTNKFYEDTKTDTELILIPYSSTSGSHSVSATLKTSANTGSCNKGVNNRENATQYVPTRTKNFTVIADCNGTLDGNTLYTFNSVSSGVQHHVVMNQGGWNWTKTSGNLSWSTANSGKNMNFTIYYGTATFTATKSGCSRTITFSGY